jgi:hypothetical protein
MNSNELTSLINIHGVIKGKNKHGEPCEVHGRIKEFDDKWIWFEGNEGNCYLFKRARVKFMQKDLPD